MDLLRFYTAGSVDDGKSTLIGRLLFDSNSISTDIIETLTQQSKTAFDNAGFNLALLTDGLRAEREQGITIDVAYKFFSTDKRKFIIADTPGHFEYTRNMFTGASNAQLAILMIDARNGIVDQTKRHAVIASILKIPHLLVCVNKMDLVNYSEEKFNSIKENFVQFSEKLNLSKVSFLPISALVGDNVVHSSKNMPWYKDTTLLHFLETTNCSLSTNELPSRFQVQCVIKPQTNVLPNYRGYAGKIWTGTFKVGEKVVVLPSGIETEISKIEVFQKDVQQATSKTPVVVHLKDAIDVSRGNLIAPVNQLPISNKEITATICWMDDTSFTSGQKVLLQQNAFITKAVIKEVLAKVDIHSGSQLVSDGSIKLNDICKVIIKTTELLSYDTYNANRYLGSFILIDENTNNTIAAGVIE